MAWFRRRHAVVVAAREIELASRVERALMALAAHARQVEDRVERLEQRVDRAVEAAIDTASQEDLLDLRMHSARLSAELSRVTMELRSEIARVEDGRLTPDQQRLQTLAAQIVDLSDALDAPPAPPQSSSAIADVA